MKSLSGLWQFRALFSFALVLVLFLSVAALIPLVQLRASLGEIAAADAESDLVMLEGLIREAMLRHDYTTIDQYLTYWGSRNQKVLDLKAVAANGYVFSEFSRPDAPHPHPIDLTREIRQDGRTIATLHLSEDLDLLMHAADRAIRKNVISLLLFTVAMGSILWVTLRRTAIVPMQRLVGEVNRLNATLEERIRLRTAGIEQANEELEHEIMVRFRAEEELRGSEERYRSIIDFAVDGVLMLDPSAEKGPVITEANEAACRMHGYGKGELIGLPISSLGPPENEALIRERTERLLGGEQMTFEVTHLRKDGSPLPLEVSSRKIVIRGRPYLLSIERDITHRKQEERLIQDAHEYLALQNEELRKIDSIKDALLRDVSHELKTPVAKHAMQLEILKGLLEGNRLSEAEKKAFRVMKESIRRQNAAIHNLLDLGRLESGGRTYLKEPFRLDGLVEEVLAGFGESVDEGGIALSLDLPQITLKSDADMLWHVIENLVGNAIKFRPREGGRISIAARIEGEEVVLEVRDNGLGMTREVQEKIFSRFYQATASAEGSGVGLTICQRIVDDLGGSIRLESEGLGLGSTAEVRLPLA